MYIKESDRKLFNDASLIFLEKTKVDLPDLFLKKWLKSNAKKEFSDIEFEIEYKKYVLRQMKAYGNINMGNKEIEGVVHNILKNKKESEKMMNEVILIELVEYFKSKMKLIKKSVSLNEFIKLANNQK